MAKKQSTKHAWKFFRVGGVDQVVIDRAVDIENLHELDLKLWIAVAMPTRGVALDAKTTAILDTDEDGRIRAPDILAAIAWLKEQVDDLEELFLGTGDVRIARIKSDALRETARRIAGPDAEVVTLADVLAADVKFTSGRFNGDGIITKETPEDAALSAVVEETIATHGSVPDRHGEPGIDAAKLGAFFDEAAALVAWRAERVSAELPLGESTEAAAAELRALAPKLEDYFARCSMAAFDERVVAASHGSDAELAALASKELSVEAPEIARMPIARIAPNAPLPFEGRVNPAFAAKLVSFRDRVVRPLLGATTNTLTEAQYRSLLAKLAAYEAWYSKMPSTKLVGLAPERLDELVAGDAKERLAKLIDEDTARKDELDHILAIEKLAFLHRDLVTVLRNFVTFSDFYSKKRALFQLGTLYLDGRGCDLCVEVVDQPKHAALAALAGTYLAYCECKRMGQPSRKIVAAFTAGDSDNLMAGRNGVFIDRDGNAWDATITQVVENPISIRQAFWAPYKRFVRLVEEQVAKRASDANAEKETELAEVATQTAHAGAPPTNAPAPAPAAPGRSGTKIDVGTVAAIGVAIGGIGAMVTGVLSTFLGLGVFMPVGVAAIVLMISSPSMLLAYLKLRRRNLGPILDASGWAVNGLATVNVPFGGVLTKVAALPPGTERVLTDPYATKPVPWKAYTALALVLVPLAVWTTGKLDPYLPRQARLSTLLASRGDAESEPAALGDTGVPTSTTPQP